MAPAKIGTDRFLWSVPFFAPLLSSRSAPIRDLPSKARFSLIAERLQEPRKGITRVRFAHDKTRAKIGTDGLLTSVPFFARDRDPDQEHCQDDV